MEIHIGEKWGKRYDNFRYYIPFKIKYGIKFHDFRKHGEILVHPTMYDEASFIPLENDIIFDIGSQYGDYGLLWEKRNKALVYAFEGLKNNFDEMQIDLKLNKSHINSYNKFIGNGGFISYDEHGNMARMAETSMPDVPTMKIDEFVFENNVVPSIMKIDVEGFEYQVLEGSNKTIEMFHPRITIETHSRELRKKCDEFLVNHGYALKYEGRTVRGKDWMDEVVNLFYGVKK